MAFFDELKKNLSGVSGTMAKTSETVVKKSGNVLEIQKAKIKKVSLESDMKENYAKLGQLYFENYAVGDMPAEMAAICEKVTACQHAIAEADQRISALKGVVICSNCQAEVDKDASYCPKCGTEIVHVVEEADTEADETAEEETVEVMDADCAAETVEAEAADAAEAAETESDAEEEKTQDAADCGSAETETSVEE